MEIFIAIAGIICFAIMAIYVVVETFFKSKPKV